MSLFSSFPKPHAALDLHQHVLPQLHRFLNRGEGLGVNINNLPKGINISNLTGDKILDLISGFFSYSTLQSFIYQVKLWYASEDPFNSALGLCFYFSVFCWVLSELTGNSSIVDRAWTFMPLIYGAHFTFFDHFKHDSLKQKLFSWTGTTGTWQDSVVPDGVDPRQFLVLGLQCLWFTRLTVHAVRRGFFTLTEEDYRWPWLRKRLTWWQYKLLSVTFVAFMQNILFLIMALPQYLLMTARAKHHPTQPPPTLGLVDVVLAAAFIVTLIVEQMGDSQQQAYQTWKRDPSQRELKNKTVDELALQQAKVNRGFRTDGLFAWSRHPNCACEQLTFYILYLFTLRATVPGKVFSTLFSDLQKIASHSISTKSVDYQSLINLAKAAGPHLINYSILSPLATSLLFYSSTPLTEHISSSKYPLYKEYQKRVGMFWPHMTILKMVWLGVTARLGKVNKLVFGAGPQQSEKNKKKKNK